MGDLTASLVPETVIGSARFVARQPGVVAGTRSATEAFAQVDSALTVSWLMDDGLSVPAGGVIGSVRGPLRSILTAERTALNLLCHLSGVATATRRFVDAITAVAPECRVRDTRKTTPGMRALEKAAVRAGGGVNHRANLSESILIKDNHLGGLAVDEAISVARERWPGRFIEVECDDVAQLKIALDAGVDMVMLDNMGPDQAAHCVEIVRDSGTGTPVEVSGRVSLETAGAYARAGVNFISIGSITHSAAVLDIGLDLDRVDGDRLGDAGSTD